MALTATMGQTVIVTVAGHSAINGAVIPAGSTITLVSNNPAVATVATDPFTVPADGLSFDFPVTLVAPGDATDISSDTKTADGSTFHSSDTLIVLPAAQPGLASTTTTLSIPTV